MKPKTVLYLAGFRQPPGGESQFLAVLTGQQESESSSDIMAGGGGRDNLTKHRSQNLSIYSNNYVHFLDPEFSYIFPMTLKLGNILKSIRCINQVHIIKNYFKIHINLVKQSLLRYTPKLVVNDVYK